MTERKPPGASFESWVDKQITDAMARGEFDNLPGAGKPLENLDQPYDEVWVMRNLRRDGVPTEELLPTPLRLRKEIERLPDTVRDLRTEQAVRDVVAELNGQIRECLRLPSGPPVHLAPVDEEAVVERWRAARADTTAASAAAGVTAPSGTAAAISDAAATGVPTRRARWWHRLTGRRR